MRANLCVCAVLLVGISCPGAFGSTLPGLREALAEFETGAIQPTVCSADYAVGSRREISRFQILPAVWREYSQSRRYHDPGIAWAITARILSDREAGFRKSTGRAADPLDIYLLWNAPGQYRRAGWDRGKVSPVVLARAKRFSNLWHERVRVHPARDVANN